MNGPSGQDRQPSDPEVESWLALATVTDQLATWVSQVSSNRPSHPEEGSTCVVDQATAASHASSAARRQIVDAAHATLGPLEQSVRGLLRGMNLLYQSAGPRVIDPSCPVMARAAWEACVRLLWLLNPEEHEDRLRRMARQLVDGQRSHQLAFAAVDEEGELDAAYRETVRLVEEAGVPLAPRLNFSDNVDDLVLDGGSAYRRLSGFVHSRSETLMLATVTIPEGEGYRVRWTGHTILDHYIATAPLVEATFKAVATLDEYWTGRPLEHSADLTRARAQLGQVMA